MSDISFAGIDPGLDGCLAIIRPDGRVEFHDAPTATVSGKSTRTKNGVKARVDTTRRVFLPHAMSEMIETLGIGYCVLEKAMVMTKPGQRAASGLSMFRYGQGAGYWEMALIAHGVSWMMVAPATWKAALMKDQPKTKEAAVPAAMRLYPGAAKDLRGPKGAALSDRADALLMAHYGRAVHNPILL